MKKFITANQAAKKLYVSVETIIICFMMEDLVDDTAGEKARKEAVGL